MGSISSKLNKRSVIETAKDLCARLVRLGVEKHDEVMPRHQQEHIKWHLDCRQLACRSRNYTKNLVLPALLLQFADPDDEYLDDRVEEQRYERDLQPANRIDGVVARTQRRADEVVVQIFLDHPYDPNRAIWQGVGELLAKSLPLEVFPELRKPVIEVPAEDQHAE